ncbi:MAG: hypothetical protein Q4G22_09540 [Paracoccus sp. (in: a-proteobacteria)]|uniref:hypothetical protein n=1 Tax=Paracoccus sp. TaxID=267 RepID=UPI0026DF08D4|nr:hypothetical protein [Paracoccus sp. (in: a-proteobacteria)]MDO5632069.1 hypothetical protein [Paracoccus sp. (in: a-proteobacteria)]
MPENIRKLLEENPDLVKNLANPDFISRINSEMAKVAGLADWCVACGASSSRAVPDFSEVMQPLTRDEIRTIGKRLTNL